jgi:aryl-alcohol dehydrogenase-like predicted oxidoreductase
MDPFPLGGFSVNRVGFGAMQLPGPNAFGPPRDRDEALAVLRRAVELGVDHIDTSQFYGPDVANELIRTALHPYPQNLALVSKVGGRRDDKGAWLPAGAPAELSRDIETNLLSLGVERLAVVNLRVFESDGPDQEFDDQLSAMIEARDRGLIGGSRAEQRQPRAPAACRRAHRDRLCAKRIQSGAPGVGPGARGMRGAGDRLRPILPARRGLHAAQPGAQPPGGPGDRAAD